MPPLAGKTRTRSGKAAPSDQQSQKTVPEAHGDEAAVSVLSPLDVLCHHMTSEGYATLKRCLSRDGLHKLRLVCKQAKELVGRQFIKTLEVQVSSLGFACMHIQLCLFLPPAPLSTRVS